VYAPEASQANYILRSLFLLMGYGLEKAFVFFDTDPSSEDITQYSSAGIMMDEKHGLKPKTAYYYLATLQNRLGGWRFRAVQRYGEGNPELFEYALVDPSDAAAECRVLWCRKYRSAEDDGTTVSNFRIQRSGILTASLVRPVDKSETGEETNLTVENAGTAEAAVTVPRVSETPVFVFLETDGTSGVASGTSRPEGFRMAFYPNPVNGSAILEFDLKIRSKLRVSLFDMRGRKVGDLLDETRDAGQHRIRLDFAPLRLAAGVYAVHFQTSGATAVRKICYIK
jgi:hypothetical protein